MFHKYSSLLVIVCCSYIVVILNNCLRVLTILIYKSFDLKMNIPIVMCLYSLQFTVWRSTSILNIFLYENNVPQMILYIYRFMNKIKYVCISFFYIICACLVDSVLHPFPTKLIWIHWICNVSGWSSHIIMKRAFKSSLKLLNIIINIYKCMMQ